MSHEITNTKSKYKKYPPIPEGRRRYIVVAPVRKLFGKGGNEFFVWTLQYQTDNGENALGEQAILPTMLAPLLRVLGCEEIEPEVFDWDTDNVEGCSFTATTSRNPDKKDPTVIRIHMSEYAKEENDEDGAEILFPDQRDADVPV